ncbi:hypothetical protein Tco_1501941 [Tanacetum coccineum]
MAEIEAGESVTERRGVGTGRERGISEQGGDNSGGAGEEEKWVEIEESRARGYYCAIAEEKAGGVEWVGWGGSASKCEPHQQSHRNGGGVGKLRLVGEVVGVKDIGKMGVARGSGLLGSGEGWGGDGIGAEEVCWVGVTERVGEGWLGRDMGRRGRGGGWACEGFEGRGAGVVSVVALRNIWGVAEGVARSLGKDKGGGKMGGGRSAPGCFDRVGSVY